MTHQTISNQTATTLRGYVDALLSGDLERIGAYFAPEATWTIHGSLPVAGTYQGSGAIMDFLAAAMGRNFVSGTQKFTFGELFTDGETAILEWNVTGVGRATMAPYDNDYCGIFTIRDGRIHAVREYFDTDHVRRVLYGEPGQQAEDQR